MKFDSIQKQANVVHSVMDEIINGNPKNIIYRVKKRSVLAFKRKFKILMFSPKSHQHFFIVQIVKESQSLLYKDFDAGAISGAH